MAADHQDTVVREVAQLTLDIRRLGTLQDDGSYTVPFGELFEDAFGEQFYEALGGTLKAAKKVGNLTYGPPMLLKGPNDKDLITLTAAAAAAAPEGIGLADAAAAAAEKTAAAAAMGAAAAAASGGAGGGATIFEAAGAPAAAPAKAVGANQEDALDDAAFEQLLGMPREAFAALPKWKQIAAKKKAGIF
jgi:hypothetical protein